MASRFKGYLDDYIRRLWRGRSALNLLLLPLSVVYFISHMINFYLLSIKRRVQAYVICIGNASAGGSGKTPFAMELGALLQSRGLKVAFVSSGYGAAKKIREAVLVRSDSLASEVSEEGLMLSKLAPTVVCNNRVKACVMASHMGVDVIIMDDGFQNGCIHQDLKILIIDQAAMGNGLMIPAGPMREPLYTAMHRADVIVQVEHEFDKDFTPHPKADLIMKTDISLPEECSVESTYNAFCGIGAPDKFFASLRNKGLKLGKCITFPDHHLYKEEEIEEMLSENVKLITTSKDAIKIPSKFLGSIIIADLKVTTKLFKEEKAIVTKQLAKVKKR